ncbi:hypothetical protein ACOBQB_23065 [Streptomyces sp. G5(2025)]|uniref:hypothetical protein n=1 Tax=Streptomyces sp. G5(2025) TaxID=3406628 RepID=UPI003C29097E
MPGPPALSPSSPPTRKRRAASSARARGPARGPRRTPPQDSVGDVVRWAAFSCVLVPVVLVGYGTSLAGAGGAALGLAAVTGVCRVLLRQSERGAARQLAEQNGGHRGRHGRTGTGAHRGVRYGSENAPVD